MEDTEMVLGVGVTLWNELRVCRPGTVPREGCGMSGLSVAEVTVVTAGDRVGSAADQKKRQWNPNNKSDGACRI